MEPRALDCLASAAIQPYAQLRVAFNNTEPHQSQKQVPAAVFDTCHFPHSWRPREPQLFFSPKTNSGILVLPVSSVLGSPLPHSGSGPSFVWVLCSLLCLLGSPLCQPSPGCLPDSCGAGRGTRYHSFLAPTPGRRTELARRQHLALCKYSQAAVRY